MVGRASKRLVRRSVAAGSASVVGLVTGPCLCGDPACEWCFPGGQARMKCVAGAPLVNGCGWIGRRHECGSEEPSEGIVDACPGCGGDCEEVGPYD